MPEDDLLENLDEEPIGEVSGDKSGGDPSFDEALEGSEESEDSPVVARKKKQILNLIADHWPLPVFFTSMLALIIAFLTPSKEPEQLPEDVYVKNAFKAYKSKSYEESLKNSKLYLKHYRNDGKQIFRKLIRYIGADSKYWLINNTVDGERIFVKDVIKEFDVLKSKKYFETSPEENLFMSSRLGSMKMMQAKSNSKNQEAVTDYQDAIKFYTTPSAEGYASVYDFYLSGEKIIRDVERGTGFKVGTAGVVDSKSNDMGYSELQDFMLKSNDEKQKQEVFSNLLFAYEVLLKETPDKEVSTKNTVINNLDKKFLYAERISTLISYLIDSSQNSKRKYDTGLLRLKWGQVNAMMADIQWKNKILPLFEEALDNEKKRGKIDSGEIDAIGGINDEARIRKQHLTIISSLEKNLDSVFSYIKNARNHFVDVDNDFPVINKGGEEKDLGKQARYELGKIYYTRLTKAQKVQLKVPKYYDEFSDEVKNRYENVYIKQGSENARNYLAGVIDEDFKGNLALRSKLYLGLVYFAEKSYQQARAEFIGVRESGDNSKAVAPEKLAAAYHWARCNIEIARKKEQNAALATTPEEKRQYEHEAIQLKKDAANSLIAIKASEKDFENNEWVKAIEVLQQLEDFAKAELKKASSAVAKWYDIDNRLLHYDEAIKIYTHLQSKYKSSRSKYLGELYDANVSKIDAIKTYIDYAPQFASPDAYVNLDTQKYYEKRRLAYSAAADAAFRRGIMVSEDHKERKKYFRIAARNYKEIAEFDNMLKVISQIAVDESPENMELLGRAYMGADDLPRAIEAFKKGISKDNSQEAKSGFRPVNRYLLAKAIFRNNIDKDKDKDGQFYPIESKYKEAIDYLEDIIDEESGTQLDAEYFIRSQLLLGEIYYQMGWDYINRDLIKKFSGEKKEAGEVVAGQQNKEAENANNETDVVASADQANKEREAFDLAAQFLRSAIVRIEEGRIAVKWSERQKILDDSLMRPTKFLDGYNVGLDVFHYYAWAESLVRTQKYEKAREVFKKVSDLYQVTSEKSKPIIRSVNPWAPEWRLMALKGHAQSFVEEGNTYLKQNKQYKKAHAAWQEAIMAYKSLAIALRDEDPAESAYIERLIGDAFQRYIDADKESKGSFTTAISLNISDLEEQARVHYKQAIVQSKRKKGSDNKRGARLTNSAVIQKAWDDYRQIIKNMQDKIQKYKLDLNAY